MEQFNTSNTKKDIHDMNTVFFHIAKQDFYPVGTSYEHIDNISKYDDNSIDHIIIQDLLDFYPEEEVETVLKEVVSKLKPEGKLDIQSIDIKMLGVGIAFNDVTIDLTKQILYPFKRSIHTMSEISDLCKKHNLSIDIKKYINIFEYYISSIKNVK